jgi:hypothetical protein
VTPRRVRQIVSEALRRRKVDGGSDHAMLQLARLEHALRLSAEAVARASCFWVYAYPAFLRYAAHSAGGYWARILPQASEIAS